MRETELFRGAFRGQDEVGGGSFCSVMFYVALDVVREEKAEQQKRRHTLVVCVGFPQHPCFPAGKGFDLQSSPLEERVVGRDGVKVDIKCVSAWIFSPPLP